MQAIKGKQETDACSLVRKMDVKLLYNTVSAVMKVGARAQRRVTRFRLADQGGLPGGVSTLRGTCVFEEMLPFQEIST